MEWLRVLGMCRRAGAMVMLLREMRPAAAGLLCAALGVMVLSVALPQLAAYVGSLREFLLSLGLEGEYYQVMLKAMGIVLVTQLCAQVCRDMDASSVAQRAELCGRLALLGVAVPVFIELTRLAVDVLR